MLTGARAHASTRDECDALNQALNSSPSFADIAGPAEKDETDSPSLLVAPGATECRVERSKSWECTWRYSKFTTDEELTGKMKGIGTVLRTCLKKLDAREVRV